MSGVKLDDQAKARLSKLYAEMGPEKLRADLQRSGWHQVLCDQATRDFAKEWLAEREKRIRFRKHAKKWLILAATTVAGAAMGYIL